MLIDLTEVCSPSYRGDAIVLTGRVNKLQKEKILGVVDYKTMTEENTRIANSIIMLVESISPLNIVS